MHAIITREAILHVRFEGRSLDIPLAELGVEPGNADARIRQALAEHLDVPVEQLRFYAIDRHETGNMTVRPEAVFG